MSETYAIWARIEFFFLRLMIDYFMYCKGSIEIRHHNTRPHLRIKWQLPDHDVVAGRHDIDHVARTTGVSEAAAAYHDARQAAGSRVGVFDDAEDAERRAQVDAQRCDGEPQTKSPVHV